MKYFYLLKHGLNDRGAYLQMKLFTNEITLVEKCSSHTNHRAGPAWVAVELFTRISFAAEILPLGVEVTRFLGLISSGNLIV